MSSRPRTSLRTPPLVRTSQLKPENSATTKALSLRGGKFFCRWGRKIEQVGFDFRKPKQKLNSKLYITPSSPLIFKKKRLSRLFGRVSLTSSSLLISKKKRSSRQIGLLFCEFSVGPKKTKATVLKLPQGKGQFGGGGTASFCPPRCGPAGEIQEKLLTRTIHYNNWSKIHFLFRPNSKILGKDGNAGMWWE